MQMMAQSLAETNAWEEVLGASNRSSQMVGLLHYIDTYCSTGNGPGRYCSRARQMSEQLSGGYFNDLFRDCGNESSEEASIICLQDLQKEYPTGDLGNRVQSQLALQERQLWSTINITNHGWAKEEIQSYLTLFPQGQFSLTAIEKLRFIDLADSIDAATFFQKHISGHGDDKLQFFQALHPTDPSAQLAQQEASRMEETLWEDTEQKGTLSGYQRYLRWYPQGNHQSEAIQQVDRLLSSGVQEIIETEDQVRWNAIKEATDPILIQRFQQLYPNSAHQADADKRLIELDVMWWEKVQALKSGVAYRQYIQLFPNGAFVQSAQSTLPNLINGDEDTQWSQLLADPSVQSCLLFIERFPNGKYTDDVRSRLRRLRHGEYTIRNDQGLYVIEFQNASNLSVISPSDTLKINDTKLASHNRLEVMLLKSGSYQLRLEDGYGKEIIVDLSSIIVAEQFAVQGDTIRVYLWGGSAPYFLRFQDTIISLRSFELDTDYPSGMVALSKRALQDITGTGVYRFEVTDIRRNQVQEAGIVSLATSLTKTLITIGVVLLVLLAIAVFWVIMNRRINKKRTVFDDMGLTDDEDDEWGTEVID